MDDINPHYTCDKCQKKDHEIDRLKRVIARRKRKTSKTPSRDTVIKEEKDLIFYLAEQLADHVQTSHVWPEKNRFPLISFEHFPQDDKIRLLDMAATIVFFIKSRKQANDFFKEWLKKDKRE